MLLRQYYGDRMAGVEDFQRSHEATHPSISIKKLVACKDTGKLHLGRDLLLDEK